MDNPSTQNTNDNQAVAADNEELIDAFSNLSNEEAMAVVAKGLLEEKGFGDLDEDTEAEMIEDLVERMTDFVNRAVLEQLPEAEMAELDQMIVKDEATNEKIGELIQRAGIDTSEAVMQALEKFREIYLNGAEE